MIIKINFLKSISIFSCFLALSSSLTYCHSGEKKPLADTQKEDSIPATEVINLQKGKISSSLKIPGELIPYQQVNIYAKENSFVKKVFVDVGSEVKQGQLLVSMEAPEINSKLSEAQSNLKSIQAIYISTKAHYERLLETSKTPGTISRNDLDQALAQVNSENARLQGAKAAYEAIAASKNYLNIQAPFSGVITTRNVNPGAYVGPSGKGSDQPLFVLQEQKKLRLVISVPEIYTGILTHLDAVSFNVKSIPDHTFTAKVKRLAGALDDRLRSERLEMDVMNNDKKLLPGMYAEVNIPLPAKDSTFIIPKTALVSSTEKVFVIRVVNQKTEWVDVKKGREANDKVEVYGNLNEGDEIIKTATDEIRNGADIKNIRRV
ncbi:efflux RND transporter periplasmic adaptor subunit [Segetibacter koreensis]|uniref:efflux RND transporter periplasmic adaptor subunit n=1 Tax=Segetibacter koreensis TaxID=398037 RepID=UPI000369EEAB|nr:efflux RND transporter periplasmic adaptor subunit [Segetibacter koreensis]